MKSVIEIAPIIARKLNINVLEIIALKPEDGSGNKWIYTLKGQPSSYINLLAR